MENKKTERCFFIFAIFSYNDGFWWEKMRLQTKCSLVCRLTLPISIHQYIWQLGMYFWQLFLKRYKICVEFISMIKKNNPQSSQFYKFQPCTGCYPLLDVRSPLNREQMMEKSDEDWDFKFHFLFLLFRAFHSPSWVAKLPKSSFTFLFLSESLKHGARKKKKLEAFF